MTFILNGFHIIYLDYNPAPATGDHAIDTHTANIVESASPDFNSSAMPHNPAARYPWQLLVALAFIVFPLAMGLIQLYASWHVGMNQDLLEGVITRKFYGWMLLAGFMLTLSAFNQIRTHHREFKGKDLSIAIVALLYVMFAFAMILTAYSRGLSGRAIISGLILVAGLPILIKTLYKLSHKPSKYLTQWEPGLRSVPEAAWPAWAVGQSFVLFQIPYLWAGKISGWLLIPLIIGSLFLTIPLITKVNRAEWLKARPAIAWLLITLLMAVSMGGVAVLLDKARCEISKPMVTAKDFEKPSRLPDSLDH